MRNNLLFCLAAAFLFVFVSASVASAAASNNNGNNNIRVVLDSPRGNEKKTRLMIKNKNVLLGGDSESLADLRALVDRAKTEFRSINDKTKRMGVETKEILVELRDHLRRNLGDLNYNAKEIGLYAALTVALSVTLKTVVFSKDYNSKTVNLGKMDYFLSSASAATATSRLDASVVVAGKKKKKSSLSLGVTPSVVSTDGNTYIQTVKESRRRRKSSSSSSIFSSSSFYAKKNAHEEEEEDGQQAQVIIDRFTDLYDNHNNDRRTTSFSHNAVVNSMPASTRRSLKAKRIRVRGGSGAGSSPGLAERLEIGGYFAAWYALNVVYNIVNKKILNVLPAPLTVGSIQFGVGSIYAILVWLLRFRPRPTLTKSGQASVASVGAYHTLGQLCTMMSLQAGPVSFSHIVKAMEPFFSAIVSGFWFGKWMPPQVYATLIPVVGGVGYACLKELSFSWLAFGAAMASNLFFALRAVSSKAALQSGKGVGTNITPPTMFGLVTCAAFLLSLPLTLTEKSGFAALWSSALDQVESKSQLIRAIVLSGLFHYLNNEVMYMALGSVHPVTLAVGNTMKRVFILVASVLVFRNPVSLQAAIGSAVGISGVLLYSLTKQHYESLENKNNNQNKKKAKNPPGAASNNNKKSRSKGKGRR